MQLVENGAGGVFVNAAAFHAHVAVFHDIAAADAVASAGEFKRVDNLIGGEAFAVEGHGVALFEINGDFFGGVGGLFHGHAAFMADGIGSEAGIFQFGSFEARMQHVGVHAVAFGALGNRNAIGLGECVQSRAAHEIPFTPRGDDPDGRIEGLGGKFEADLVVALAGGAVGDGVGTFLVGDLNESLGNERTGDGSAEKVPVFIDGGGTDHGEDEVSGHFLTQVENVGFLGAGLVSFLFNAGEILGLTEVGRHGDDVAVVGVDEPFENDGSVEAAGIGEDDFAGITHNVCFLCVFRKRFGKTPGRGALSVL